MSMCNRSIFSTTWMCIINGITQQQHYTNNFIEITPNTIMNTHKISLFLHYTFYGYYPNKPPYLSIHLISALSKRFLLIWNKKYQNQVEKIKRRFNVCVLRIDKYCLAKAFINSCRSLFPSKIIPIVFYFSLTHSFLQLLMMNNATVWIQSKWQQTNYYHERRGFLFYQRITCFTYFVLFEMEGRRERTRIRKCLSFTYPKLSAKRMPKFMLCNKKPKL